MSADVDLLLEWLAAKRRHVAGTLDELSEELRLRPVLPSGWSLAGLVQHLALDVERFWFRAVVAGEDVALLGGAGGWTVPPTRTSDEVLALYHDECDRSDEIVRTTDPEAPPRWWPEGECPYADTREILAHVLVETATHAGHADAARELLDGRQRLVLTE